ncbi:unnamed protein product [Peniophora sp. CBMAI 1063]|nr:unnamed protein product [Peniophora sp. CBMAI 1063]
MSTNVSSPILSLPDDISILLLATAAQTEPPRGIGFRCARNQALGFLRLSEVCRRWRALLLSMPSIWAEVVFTIPPAPATLALSRSKSHPLRASIPSITIPINYRPGKPTGREHNYLIALLAEHAARIGTLSASDLEAKDYRVAFRDPLPLLKRLVFIHIGSPPSPRDIGNICIDAPTLHTMEIMIDEGSNIQFPITYDNAPGITLKLPALRSISISLIDIRMKDSNLRWIVPLLRNTPLIEVLHLSFSVDSGTRAQWNTLFKDQPVELSRLRRLELEGGPQANTLDLFRYIQSPSLRRTNIKHHLSDQSGKAADAIKYLCHTLHRPSYDGLLVRLDATYIRTCTLTVAVFPSLHPVTFYSPESLLKGDLPDIAVVSTGSTLPPDAPLHRQMIDMLAAALKDNAPKQLVVDAPTFKAWPSALQTILPLCSQVTQLFVWHPWNHREPGFPIFPSPVILPALETLSIRPVFDAISYKQYRRAIGAWWLELTSWLERRAHATTRIRKLYIYGLDRQPDHGQVKRKHEVAEAQLRQRAAEFVDELFDERVRRSSPPRHFTVTASSSESSSDE